MSMAIVKIAGRAVCAAQESVHGHQPGGDDTDIYKDIDELFVNGILTENVNGSINQLDSDNCPRTFVDRTKPIYGTKLGDLLPFDAIEEASIPIGAP